MPLIRGRSRIWFYQDRTANTEPVHPPPFQHNLRNTTKHTSKQTRQKNCVRKTACPFVEATDRWAGGTKENGVPPSPAHPHPNIIELNGRGGERECKGQVLCAPCKTRRNKNCKLGQTGRTFSRERDVLVPKPDGPVDAKKRKHHTRNAHPVAFMSEIVGRKKCSKHGSCFHV